MRKISFGVIGCGNVANSYYLPYISKKHKLIAVCDLIEERAKRSARLWGAKKWYKDPERLLKDKEIEAVAILTNFDSHARLAIRAAEEGKHYILQKPMGLSIKEIEEVKRKTKKAGVKAIIEPSEALLSQLMIKLKEALSEIGRHSFSIWHIGYEGPNWSKSFFDSKLGGGVINDMMVYNVSYVYTFFGMPKRVTAQGSIFMPIRYIIPSEKVTSLIREDTYGKGVYDFYGVKPTVPVKVTAYDNVVATLEYDGSEAILISNFTTFSELKMPVFQIYGLEGSIAVKRVPKPEIEISARSKKIRITDISTREYYGISVDHLVECIEEEKDPLPSVEWGYNVTKILISISQSAREERTIHLS